MPKSHFANPLRWLGADTKIQSSIISSEFYKNFSANSKSGIPGRDADATHLSTVFFLILDLANDTGILQSSLFTRRSQNLVLPKLLSWGFWRYGQFIK